MGVRVAVDAMGGDFAPKVNLDGGLLALKDKADLHLLFVGQKNLISAQMPAAATAFKDRWEIVDAAEVISMDDHGASVIRKKKDSSIHVGLRLMKDGKADAFISAGNSGAMMAGAVLVLGRIAEVERPAILIKLPTANGYISILDAGANVDCKASHLAQFAEMGFLYAREVEKLENPRIGLLSNGSENHKGNDLTREADRLIREAGKVPYVGYVEGNDLFTAKVDVVVCDGFVGNVILKVSEGLADTAFHWFRTELTKDMMGLMGVFLMRKVLRNFRTKFDYQPYGAAPLLGVNGIAMISHGRSTEIAIRNGILRSYQAATDRLVEKMTHALAQVSATKTPPAQGTLS